MCAVLGLGRFLSNSNVSVEFCTNPNDRTGISDVDRRTSLLNPVIFSEGSKFFVILS